MIAIAKSPSDNVKKTVHNKYLVVNLKQLQRLGCIFIIFAAILIAANFIFPLDMRRYRETSVVIRSLQGQWLHVFQTKDEKWRLLSTVHDVDPIYIRTLLEKEDRFYYHHFGINPLAIIRAIYQMLRSRKIVSGGSTITMQTARLLEPRPRNMRSKVLECLRALQLEWQYSKDEILNIYLTLAPFGGNLEGIKAASWSYFKKLPRHLTPAEIALLVALPQSPSRLRPDYFPNNALAARQNILKFMLDHYIIEEIKFDVQKKESVLAKRWSFPNMIPHLAIRLKRSYPQKKQIDTTIDIALQTRLQHVLERYGILIPARANAAILVLDNYNKQVITYIGSRDFFDYNHSGQVDYVCSYRSPGSTLKPFIYGLGFDRGIIQPDSLLLDDHQRFGTYCPGNFDRSVHGVVSVREALVRSLNIPVVYILNSLGPVRFLGTLKEAGIIPKIGQSFERPNLAIALGGLGVTLEQLVRLYSGLASQGKVPELLYTNPNSNTIMEGVRLLSSKSAHQVTKILQSQDVTLPSLAIRSSQNIAYKTGTSHGCRDAWIIGYNQRYVVGIWLGVADGSSMGAVSARTLITPLMRQIFFHLPASTRSSIGPSLKPKNVMRIKNLQKNNASSKAVLYRNNPHILFPINDTIIELSNHSNFGLPLNVVGGKKPYTWFIDGILLSVPSWHQKTHWQVQQQGYYNLIVIDSQGNRDSVNIEIR